MKLFDCLDFKPVWGLLNEPYHNSGPRRPYYSPEALIKALMLQRFMRIPSERVLAEKLARCRDYRRICGFRRKTPCRGCFTHFRRNRFREERFKEAFNFMVKQAVALGAVRGYAISIDSTAFKAYSAREAKKGKSDPDADVGRAGRTYILGYRVHLACVEGDVPLAFTVQPISRNDKLFYRQLLEEASKAGVHFRVVAADRQYDSIMLRQWTWKTFNAETAIPTRHKHESRKSLQVDAKFRVSGPKRLVGAYHKRLCVERVFKKLKRQLNLEGHHLRGLANVTIHACLTLMCVLAAIIASYKTGKPGKARSIKYWTN
ncbi:MAG: transposase [Candidatus Bathyarchaeia archaeon]